MKMIIIKFFLNLLVIVMKYQNITYDEVDKLFIEKDCEYANSCSQLKGYEINEYGDLTVSTINIYNTWVQKLFRITNDNAVNEFYVMTNILINSHGNSYAYI